MQPTDSTPKIAVTSSAVLSNKPQGRLQKQNFDSLVDQKGYPVIIQKAMTCPCASVGSQALPSCRNCGGSGWIWINPASTKAIMQSMNKNTKFKEWSKENLGTASVTTFDEVELGYMDKITVLNSESSYSQVIRPKVYTDDNILRSTLTYAPLSIEAIFRFDTATNALIGLTVPTDAVINGNIIEFHEDLKAIDGLTITIRYRHNQEYAVLDIPRSVISSESIHHDTKIEQQQKYPIHAVARLFHYTINETSIDGTYLHDNSFTPSCSEYTTCAINGYTIQVESYTQGEIDETTPKTGQIIFNLTTKLYQGWTGSEWFVFGQDLVWSDDQW